jgi:AraC-like DNA-binding protein
VSSNTTAVVLHSLFSVDDCLPRERFECWRHSIAAIFDVDATQDVIGDFHATIDSHLVGPLMLATTRTRRQHWIRSARTIARDLMDHYMVQLYESGRQTVRTDGESRPMDSGQLIVCDLQRTMDNVTTDFQNLSVIIPRRLLEPRLERPDAAHGLIIDGAAAPGSVLRDHLTALREAVGGLAADEAEGVAEATVDMVAACINGTECAALGRPAAPALPLLPRIKRYLRENLNDAMLTPESIASRQGVSQRKLHEIFEAEGGVLIYLRVLRLKAAFDTLRDPRQISRPIEDIAREAGYGSEAAFDRAFRSMFDVAAGEVRRAAEMGIQSFVPPPGLDRRYETWLNNLCPSSAPR